MKEFYSKNSVNYKAECPIKNVLYTYCDTNGEYHRIKIVSFFSKSAYVYKIDSGNFENVSNHLIYHLIEKFLQLKPMAFRASLASSLIISIIFFIKYLNHFLFIKILVLKIGQMNAKNILNLL
jgi:hypothetical protein